MKSRKILAIIAVLALLASPAFAGKLTVGSSVKGQFIDLKVLGMEDSLKSGGEAVIDGTTISQSSATGAVEVLELEQLDVDQPLLLVVCTEAAQNTCSTYTSTNSTKTGAIQVKINNGSTTVTRWIQLFNDPN